MAAGISSPTCRDTILLLVNNARLLSTRYSATAADYILTATGGSRLETGEMRYDRKGIFGATPDRSAMQRLITCIKIHLLDVVVVQTDRETRLALRMRQP
jgi:hypothetical protein